MAGSAMMAGLDWSLIPGELLVRKWIGSELEVEFMVTNGCLEERRKQIFRCKMKN